MNDNAAYHCQTPFADADAQALVVYCSDGRFAHHFDEFIVQSLGLTCCDRIAIPGGPAYLADHAGVEVDAASLLDQIRFMVEAHRLSRVILIMHEDCGCYAHKLGLPAGPGQQQRQIEDLALAVGVIGDACANVTIECHLALLDGNAMRFERVGA